MRVVLAIAVLLLLPACAHASVVNVETVDSCRDDLACSKYAGGHPVPVIDYQAGAGEINHVTVARVGEGVRISDSGAAIAAGDGCRSLSAHEAACPPGGEAPIPGFAAQLLDGADTLAISGALGSETSVDGGAGDDTLSGGGDDDTLAGGSGADRLDGGAGTDTLSFAGRPAGVTVDLARGRTSEGDVLAGFEAVDGGDGRDRLLGSSAAETLRGGAGADVLRGGGGDDVLEGGLGADAVDGGPGDDQISGDPPQGDGYYTPIVHLSADVLGGGPGNDQITDSGGANRIEGGRGDDLLVGGSGRDRMSGGPGVDYLLGNGGADVLLGGPGRDRLRGSAGDDALSGGPGPDRLAGDGGSDRLVGGRGPDLISGGSGRDDVVARDGRRDRVDCGAGRDRARIDAKDHVHACETLRPRGYT
jgi:Ca2+-binding RTX toxin-like protein